MGLKEKVAIGITVLGIAIGGYSLNQFHNYDIHVLDEDFKKVWMLRNNLLNQQREISDRIYDFEPIGLDLRSKAEEFDSLLQQGEVQKEWKKFNSDQGRLGVYTLGEIGGFVLSIMGGAYLIGQKRKKQ